MLQEAFLFYQIQFAPTGEEQMKKTIVNLGISLGIILLCSTGFSMETSSLLSKSTTHLKRTFDINLSHYFTFTVKDINSLYDNLATVPLDWNGNLGRYVISNTAMRGANKAIKIIQSRKFNLTLNDQISFLVCVAAISRAEQTGDAFLSPSSQSKQFTENPNLTYDSDKKIVMDNTTGQQLNVQELKEAFQQWIAYKISLLKPLTLAGKKISLDLGSSYSVTLDFQKSSEEIKNLLVSLPIAGGDQSGRYTIGAQSIAPTIEVVDNILMGKYALTIEQAQRFLICVAAQLRIDQDPSAALGNRISETGNYRSLTENKNVTYNPELNTLKGFNTPILSSAKLIEAFDLWINYQKLKANSGLKKGSLLHKTKTLTHKSLTKQKTLKKQKTLQTPAEIIPLVVIPEREILSKMVNYFKRHFVENANILIKKYDMNAPLKKQKIDFLKQLIPLLGEENIQKILNLEIANLEDLKIIDNTFEDVNNILENQKSSVEEYKNGIFKLIEDDSETSFFDAANYFLTDTLSSSESDEEQENLDEQDPIKTIFQSITENYEKKRELDHLYEPQNFDEYILSKGKNLSMDFLNWAPSPQDSPTQGFKFHISATPQSALKVLEAVKKEVFSQLPVPYKTTGSMEQLDELNSLYYDDQAGKFITIYTNSPEEAKKLSILLDKALLKLPSDYFVNVPSDHPLGHSGGLYVRFGAYFGHFITIPKPGGGTEDIEDNRLGPWKPDVIEDPFQDIAFQNRQ